MTLDVVVPARRPATVERLLRSLGTGEEIPDLVTLVSNEVPPGIETFGLPVRILRFRSATYPVGDRDVALRRDVGIWNSPCSHLLTLDDDLVAPADLVRATRTLLAGERYLWGHHRYLSFTGRPLGELARLPCTAGRTREHPPNAWHRWMSCYGGLFAGETQLVRDVGGFDLIFSCRQAGEDQDFGKRLAHAVHRTDRVYIHEPPFAWHPTEREPWGDAGYSNLCRDGHDRVCTTFRDVPVERCTRCPFLRALDDGRLFRNHVLWPYDPALVDVVAEQL